MCGANGTHGLCDERRQARITDAAPCPTGPAAGNRRSQRDIAKVRYVTQALRLGSLPASFNGSQDADDAVLETLIMQVRL